MPGDEAELEWAMVATWSGRDVNELRFLQYMDSVPFALGYDTRIARMQLDRCIRFGFPGDPEASGNYVEYLVSVWMDFAAVRGVIQDRDDPYRHAIDSGRRARPVSSGRDGKVTVDVEQATGNIDRDDSFDQSILLVGAARALCAGSWQTTSMLCPSGPMTKAA